MCYQELFQFALMAQQTTQAGKTQRSIDDALKAAKTPPAATSPQTTALTRKPSEGYPGTLLTGPQGLSPGSQNLGANTLLGR